MQLMPFYRANYGSYVVTELAAQNYTSLVDCQVGYQLQNYFLKHGTSSTTDNVSLTLNMFT